MNFVATISQKENWTRHWFVDLEQKGLDQGGGGVDLRRVKGQKGDEGRASGPSGKRLSRH